MNAKERDSIKKQLGALIDLDQLLFSVLESMPGLVTIMNKDYQVLYKNWDKIIPPEQIVDKTLCFQAYMSRDKVCENCCVAKVFSGGCLQHDEVVNTANGKIFEINAYPIKDKAGNVILAVEHVRDITEQKKFEMLLNIKQKNLEAIFDAAPFGMMLINQDMKIVRANNNMRDVFCKDYKEIINHLPGEAINCKNSTLDAKGCGSSPVCPECLLCNSISSVFKTNSAIQNMEIQHEIQIGDQLVKPWYKLNIEPVIIDQVNYAVITIEDITGIKKTEVELKQAKERAEKAQMDLKNANAQLEASVEKAHLMTHEAVAANLSKSQFLVNMSHEIRTPMNAIIGFTEVLSEENITEEQKHHINIIRESAEHLLKLINDILDYSRLEAGKIDVEFMDCSLEKLFAVIGTIARPQARQKGLAFDVTYSGTLPSSIKTDPIRLRQCLLNLITNAFKYTKEGHVFVKVVSEDVNGKSCIRFDVEDTGVGISSEKIETIFDEFIQNDPKKSHSLSGTGLGLVITKRLAKLLGGELSVKSEEGKGSVFSIVIPSGAENKKDVITSQPEALILQHESVSNVNSAATGAGNRVLVAEDSKTNQMLINLLLEKLGLHPVIVDNGKEAVDKVMKEPFDLIFMDMQMPVMDGYEATRTLRRNGCNLTIIALTAYAMQGDREKCLSTGCTDYITKPIDRNKLTEVVRKYLFKDLKSSEEPLAVGNN